MDAKRQCERQSFQLASILNEEAQAFVELQVMKLNAPLWIGLNKEEVYSIDIYDSIGTYLLLCDRML